MLLEIVYVSVLLLAIVGLVWALVSQHVWGKQNDMDMRTAGQIQLDGIPRQESRTKYIVEYYRRHKYVDRETIEALNRYAVIMRQRVQNTHDIDDEIEYQRAQKDLNNARAYYVKFGG